MVPPFYSTTPAPSRRELRVPLPGFLFPIPVAIGFALAAPSAAFAQAAPPAAPPAAPKPNPERTFNSLDTNHDGRLSEAEFSRLSSVSAYFREHPDQVTPVFRKLDATGSGSLALAEFQKLYEMGKGRAPAKTEPPPTTPRPNVPQPVKPVADTIPRVEDTAFFEKNIRPVLVEKCYKCHSVESEKVKGGLVLDTREGIRKGGDTGPAVVPGDVASSLLMEALRYSNKDMQMPPEKQGGKLSDDMIANFERWVRMGAPDPREKKAQSAVASISSWDTENAKKHWAFKAPQRQSPPAVKDTSWPKSDLDRFVLAQLETKSIMPVADASPRTLVRRIYFDLIGLPPSPEDVEQFVQEASKDRSHALDALVERLLKSPRFGERWGRHWLDVARYAESTGREVNCTLPHAWRYRDYVIAAFNADKPYNQFIREQIAGDLLPAKDNRERAEHQIATGFLAIGSHSLSEKNPKQFSLDMADEQIDAVSQAVLGLTVACAPLSRSQI